MPTRRFLAILPLCVAMACSDGGGSDDEPEPAALEIAACGEITTPGRYRLVRDLPDAPRSAPCLVVRDTSDVTIDCDDHAIRGLSALDVQRVDGFRVERCRLERPPGAFDPTAPHPGVLRIIDGTNGVVTESRVGLPGMLVIHASGLQVTRNEIESLGLFESTRVSVAGNLLVRPLGVGVISVVSSNNGAFNRFLDNTVDGGWDGVRTRAHEDQIGADDGFLLMDEYDAEVSGNVIRNVWDCGIETLGVTARSRFERNAIENAGICGIGGWYWSSLRDNVIADNVVRQSCALFHFYRFYGLRPAEPLQHGERPADDFVYIENNRFEGNTLERYRDGCDEYAARLLFDYGGEWTNYPLLPGERLPAREEHVFGNNLFRGNDFGTDALPVLFGEEDPRFVVDGGGNRCRQPETDGYPLRCE